MKGNAPRVRLLQLIQTALSRADVLCGKETQVLIRCRREQDRRLIEKLWPGAGIYERYAYVRDLNEDTGEE